MSINNDRRSAIICSHVLDGGMPILRIKRDELDEDDPSDSGWQFLCDSGKREDMSTIRIISIAEAIDIDSTIAEYIDKPAGSIFIRSSASDCWTIENIN